MATATEIYVGGMDDGDFVSGDDGLTWVFTGLQGFGTGSPTMAFNGVNVVAGHGGFLRGIYRRVGNNWVQTLSGVDGQKIVADANGVFFASMGPQTGAGVYRSTDNAASWQKVSSLTGTIAVGVGKIFLLSNFEVYQSDNGGNNWTKLASVPGSGNILFQDIIYNGGRLYAAVDPVGIFESDTSFTKWTRVVDGPTQTRRFTAGANKLFLSTAEGLYLLNDKTPRTARATAILANGFVVGFKVIDGGYGYTNSPVPSVTIIGEPGTGAVAKAVVNEGRVESIEVLNPGKGYPETVIVIIEAPPKFPWLEIIVSKVMVTLHLTEGRKYILDSSNDLSSWTRVGEEFIAAMETVVKELEVVSTGRFFRIREVP